MNNWLWSEPGYLVQIWHQNYSYTGNTNNWLDVDNKNIFRLWLERQGLIWKYLKTFHSVKWIVRTATALQYTALKDSSKKAIILNYFLSWPKMHVINYLGFIQQK